MVLHRRKSEATLLNGDNLNMIKINGFIDVSTADLDEDPDT